MKFKVAIKAEIPVNGVLAKLNWLCFGTNKPVGATKDQSLQIIA